MWRRRCVIPRDKSSFAHAPVVTGRLAKALRRVPVLRGVAALWDILLIGMRSLAFSAEVAIEDESDQSDVEPAESEGSSFVWASLAFGLAIGVGLFLVLPIFVTRIADPSIESDLLSNLLEGLVRLVLLVAYLSIIGLLPDIRRTFEYHGAEHKTVNAVEAGDELTVDNVMLPQFNPSALRHEFLANRCGPFRYWYSPRSGGPTCRCESVRESFWCH